MLITEKYVFFHDEWPSNFEECKITWVNPENKRKHTFTSTEQAFMYRKAILFKDYEIAGKILKTDNPLFCKQLGRRVKNYDDEVWKSVRYETFYELNYLKYTQNPILKKKLLNKEFDNKTFVEASPYDKVWGIGYDKNEAPSIETDKWGQNLLGKIVTEIRQKLLEEENV